MRLSQGLLPNMELLGKMFPAILDTKKCLMKKGFENMQQIYRRTPMPKCDFIKVAKQLY